MKTYQNAAHRVHGNTLNRNTICATGLSSFSLRTISASRFYINKGTPQKEYFYSIASLLHPTPLQKNHEHARVSHNLVGLGVGTHLR